MLLNREWASDGSEVQCMHVCECLTLPRGLLQQHVDAARLIDRFDAVILLLCLFVVCVGLCGCV